MAGGTSLFLVLLLSTGRKLRPLRLHLNVYSRISLRLLFIFFLTTLCCSRKVCLALLKYIELNWRYAQHVYHTNSSNWKPSCLLVRFLRECTHTMYGCLVISMPNRTRTQISNIGWLHVCCNRILSLPFTHTQTVVSHESPLVQRCQIVRFFFVFENI